MRFLLTVILCSLMAVSMAHGAQTDVKANGGHIDTVTSVERINHITTMTVGGTEYEIGDAGKIFVTIAENGFAINNALCLGEVFYPNGTELLSYTTMTFLEDGIYYHDFIVPNTTGVYPVEVLCTYQSVSQEKNASVGTRILGLGSGALSNTYAIDGTYWTANENLGDSRRISNQFNYTGFNTSIGSILSVDIEFTGKRPQEGTDPATDLLNFSLYNYVTNRYDTVGNDFSYSTTDITKQYIMIANASAYVSSGGNASILITDSVGLATDIANTIFSIDDLHVRIYLSLANTSVTNIAGGGELHVTRHNTDILAAISSLNATQQGAVNYTLIGQIVNQSLSSVNLSINQSLLSQIYAQLQNLSIAIAGINGNLTFPNVTAINQSLSDLIIAENAKPQQWDASTIFIILFVILLLTCLWINSPAFYGVVGMFGLILGIILIGTIGFWMGIIIGGIGVIIGYIGIRKMF